MNHNTSDGENVSVEGANGGTRGRRHEYFVTGLAAGAMLGVGIGLWLSPHTSTLRQWLDESAREMGRRASEHYGKAGASVAAAVDSVAGTAQSVRDRLADTVVVRDTNDGTPVVPTPKA